MFHLGLLVIILGAVIVINFLIGSPINKTTLFRVAVLFYEIKTVGNLRQNCLFRYQIWVISCQMLKYHKASIHKVLCVF